jgi:hypothetical protein
MPGSRVIRCINWKGRWQTTEHTEYAEDKEVVLVLRFIFRISAIITSTSSLSVYSVVLISEFAINSWPH